MLRIGQEREVVVPESNPCLLIQFEFVLLILLAVFNYHPGDKHTVLNAGGVVAFHNNGGKRRKKKNPVGTWLALQSQCTVFQALQSQHTVFQPK